MLLLFLQVLIAWSCKTYQEKAVQQVLTTRCDRMRQSLQSTLGSQTSQCRIGGMWVTNEMGCKSRAGLGSYNRRLFRSLALHEGIFLVPNCPRQADSDDGTSCSFWRNHYFSRPNSNFWHYLDGGAYSYEGPWGYSIFVIEKFGKLWRKVPLRSSHPIRRMTGRKTWAYFLETLKYVK